MSYEATIVSNNNNTVTVEVVGEKAVERIEIPKSQVSGGSYCPGTNGYVDSAYSTFRQSAGGFNGICHQRINELAWDAHFRKQGLDPKKIKRSADYIDPKNRRR